MVLQFNPPKELVDSYLNRPSPGQEASAGIQQALQAYAAEKDKQKHEKYQQQALASLDAQRKATEFKAQADYTPEAQIPDLAKQYGMPYLSQAQSATAPTAQPQNTGYSPQGQPMSMAQPEDQAPSISPIVQAHIQETGHNPMGHDIPTSKVGLAKYKTNLETQKLQQELDKPPKGPLQTLTKEQALANGSYDPTKQVMVEPPQQKTGADSAENKLADKQLADAQKAYNSDKNREKSEAVIEKVSQASPLLKAGTIDNATAKQALQTSMTYMATGGMRVNEVELRQFGGAAALSNKMGQWYKSLDAGTLTDRDAKDMGKVLDIFEKSARKNLQDIGLRHTHQYMKRSNSAEKDSDVYSRVTGNDFGSPEAQPGESRPTIASQKDYEALPQGARYQDSNGVPHIKGQ